MPWQRRFQEACRFCQAWRWCPRYAIFDSTLFSMKFWKRFCYLTLLSVLGGSSVLPAMAQTKTSAKDIQNSCEVAEIPAIAQLTVTWTGECADGKATGVGNVLAFGAGELRYLLRGLFVEGRLNRIDDIQDCSAGACVDKVAPAILRQHAVMYQLRQSGPKAPDPAPAAKPPPAPTPAATLPTAQSAPATLPVPTTAAEPAVKVEIRAEDAIYKGNFVLDKKASLISGQGRVEFFDGRLYEGRLEAGRKVGQGLYVWSDGQRYNGNWRNDQPDGEGEWTSAKGDRYTGGFLAGRRSGKGRMVYADKTEYNGTWQDDRPAGEGIFKFANGDVYQGQFVAGEQSGTGTLTHANGDRHTGLWLKGMRDGKGVTEWKDGQRYEGDWHANRKEGQGVMRFADGGSYEGTWVNDRPVGQGTIKFASGDIYTGEVRDGLAQGKGLYTWGSGDKFEGEFAAGRPTANGVMTFYIPPTADTASAPETPANAQVPTATQQAPADVEPAPATPDSAATLCSRAYNRARGVAALKKFIETYPQDECERHALARQKIAALEENERKVARQAAERQAQAKALVGLAVAYRQDYTHCVASGSGPCQNVIYSFEVKGKIREVNLAKQAVMLQVTSVSLLGNEKGAPAQLFAEGKNAATEAFKKRTVGSVQSKTEAEVGIEF